MVRFIIKKELAIRFIHETIYIPIWLDLLSSQTTDNSILGDIFTFQYG